MKLGAFLETYGPSLDNAILRMFPPLYDDEARVTCGFDVARLIRRPMGRQGDAIRAVALSLQRNPGTLLVGEMGVGKSSPLDTPVLTPGGWCEMGELAVGDHVIGSDGCPTEVLGVYPQGERPIYRVTFSDGASVECDEEHLWQVQKPLRKWKGQPPRVLTTRQIMDEGLAHSNGNLQHFIPLVQPVRYTDCGPEFRPLDPYLLGCLLGDGSMSQPSTNVGLTTVDREIVDSARAALPMGVVMERTPSATITYAFRKSGEVRGSVGPDNVKRALARLGLLGGRAEHKFVPLAYLMAPVGDRLALLQGLFDTDGCVARGYAVEFTTVSSSLADGVTELVRSLGGTVRRSAKQPTFVYRGSQRLGQPAYRLYVRLPESMAPFRLSRKLAAYAPGRKYGPSRAIKSIEFVGFKPAQCIKVAAADSLYVTKDFIVTHNTLVAAAAAWLAGFNRVLIMCPPHLVRKWQREIQGDGTPDHPPLFPGARAVIVSSVHDLDRIRWANTGECLFVIISHSKAKLGYKWRAAVVQRNVLTQTSQGRSLVPVNCCSTCGAPVVDDEGIPIALEELGPPRARRSCRGKVRWREVTDDGSVELRESECGAPLWTATASNVRIREPKFPLGIPMVEGGDGPHRVVIAGYIRHHMRGFFDLFVGDECFPAGTPVSTPSGAVPIERMRVGDTVLSSQNGQVVDRTVVRVLRKRLRHGLVRVRHASGSFVCTPNHKIHTANRDYVPAGQLVAGDQLLTLEDELGSDRKDLPWLRRAVPGYPSSDSGAGVLFPSLCGCRAGGQAACATRPAATCDGAGGVRLVREAISAAQEQDAPVLWTSLFHPGPLGCHRHSAAGGGASPRQDACSARRRGGACSADERESGAARGCCAHEAEAPVFGDTRWQWVYDQAANALAVGAGLAGGSVHSDGSAVVAIIGGRPGPRLPAVGGRGGWHVAPDGGAAGPRPAQDGDARGYGLAGAALLESRDRQRPAFCAVSYPACGGSAVLSVTRVESDDEFVYDLEVENTHCYFAAGVLVSNCHEYKARGSAQGLAAASLAEACGKSLVLTGTLLGGYSSTIFNVLYRFNPRIRVDFKHNDTSKWINRFGFIERITSKGDDDETGVTGRQSKRREYKVRTKEKPGVTPTVLFQIIGATVFLRLSDVSRALPPYRERVITVPLDNTPVTARLTDDKSEVTFGRSSQMASYTGLADSVKAAVNRLLALGSKRLLGIYLQSLLSYPDNCVVEEMPRDPVTGEMIGHAPALDRTHIYPKELELIRLVADAKAQGRKVLLFVTHTDKRDLTPRVCWILGQAGFATAVLKASGGTGPNGTQEVKPEDREAWVQEQVAAGIDVLVTNPKLVMTGLDLIDFPEVCWLELDYSTYVMRQASRRSWRIGQRWPVRVTYLVYDQTLQALALALVAAKYKASLMIEGELPSEGLAAMEGDDPDMYLALARKLAAQHEQADAESIEAMFVEAAESERDGGRAIGQDFALADTLDAALAPPAAEDGEAASVRTVVELDEGLASLTIDVKAKLSKKALAQVEAGQGLLL